MYFTRSKINDFKAAGVLPITIHDGRPYVLLGAEPCRTGPQGKVWRVMWGDFGGGRESCDGSAADTAAREFAEETLGLFGGCSVNNSCVLLSTQQMAGQLHAQSDCFQVVHPLKKGRYHMFISRTPFIEPVMFHLAQAQNASSHAIAGAEKTNFAWVCLPELMAAVARCSRQYHLTSRQSLWARTAPQEPGSHRMQLHPCFASSLRLAQESGLDSFVAGLLLASSPSRAHPPIPPASTPSSRCSLEAAAPEALTAAGAGAPCEGDTAAAQRDQVGATSSAGGEGLAGASSSTGGGGSCSKRAAAVWVGVRKGATPEHMMYWLQQAEVAAQLVDHLPPLLPLLDAAGAAEGGAAAAAAAAGAGGRSRSEAGGSRRKRRRRRKEQEQEAEQADDATMTAGSAGDPVSQCCAIEKVDGALADDALAVCGVNE